MTDRDPGLTFMARMRAELADELRVPITLGDLVRRQASRYQDALLGYWFEDDIRMTYAEFDERVDRLADSLLREGVRKGTHVAVMLPNCMEFPVTWIALARLGAVMVPVNSGYTAHEMHFVLTDSDAQYLVIDEAYVERFHAIENRPGLIADARIYVRGREVPEGLGSWSALLAGGVAPFEPPYVVSPQDMVSIQYTSGTTGFPKGCMLIQDYWVLLSRSAAYRGAEVQGSNVLIWAPFFYMDPQWQFLVAMWLGGTAYVARKMSLGRLHGWLRDYPVHMCIYPEPALKQALSEEDARRIELKSISIFGWSIEGRAAIEQRFKGAIAREGFGMTETGSGTLVPPPAVDMARIRCVGLPSPFRELRIVDPTDPGHRELGVGEEGELLIRGRALLLGYYKRPEANKAQFVDGWFRTGDIFRQDERGYFYIVGRIKDMIRRAGENIAAIEVESVLRTMPDIEDAAVVPVPDDLRREEVKAYLKLREGAPPPDLALCGRIIAHCRERLAAFKVPRYIAFIEGDFARTAARKIIKRELVKDAPDLRVGAFDRVDETWR